MCKKLFLAAVAIVVGVLVVRHTQFGSLVQVWWGDLMANCKKAIKPEDKVKQLEIEVGKIDAQIKQNINRLATQENEKNKLEQTVVVLRKAQKELGEEMAAVEAALETKPASKSDPKTELVVYNNKQHSRTALADELALLTTRYTHGKEQLAFKEQLLSEKTKALEEADRGINWMQSQVLRLKTEIARAKNHLERQRTQQVQGIPLSDSQIQRCDALLEEVKDALNVEDLTAKKMHAHGYDTPVKVQEDQRTVEQILSDARKAREGNAIAKDKP
jgi:chromosome segregation ATPase